MDEKDFLAELSVVSSQVKPAVGDVRDQVWRRIHAADNGVVRFEETEKGYNRWVFKMEVTAALMLLAAAPFAFGAIVSLLREMYWNGSIHTLLSTF
ncbi:MAG: hypothetical protein LIQ31_07010 [Planctomycetes bacterium]|nr:hypothetical protein [Planctomycetota bacterium]